MQHEAIYALYPNVVSIDGDGPNAIALDSNGNTVTWDASAVTTKQNELQAEWDAKQIDKQRQSAYQAESDPLFFKWQRGEATEQEWLDKIAEIKARFS